MILVRYILLLPRMTLRPRLNEEANGLVGEQKNAGRRSDASHSVEQNGRWSVLDRNRQQTNDGDKEEK